MKINNLPDYAVNHRFIVYRMSKNERWFYGAYDNVGQAAKVAAEIGGFVCERSDIDGNVAV